MKQILQLYMCIFKKIYWCVSLSKIKRALCKFPTFQHYVGLICCYCMIMLMFDSTKRDSGTTRRSLNARLVQEGKLRERHLSHQHTHAILSGKSYTDRARGWIFSGQHARWLPPLFHNRLCSQWKINSGQGPSDSTEQEQCTDYRALKALSFSSSQIGIDRGTGMFPLLRLDEFDS